jgi:hypothetical protein
MSSSETAFQVHPDCPYQLQELVKSTLDGMDHSWLATPVVDEQFTTLTLIFIA